MNLKNIMLMKEASQKRVHAVLFPLHEILEQAKLEQ